MCITIISFAKKFSSIHCCIPHFFIHVIQLHQFQLKRWTTGLPFISTPWWLQWVIACRFITMVFAKMKYVSLTFLNSPKFTITNIPNWCIHQCFPNQNLVPIRHSFTWPTFCTIWYIWLPSSLCWPSSNLYYILWLYNYSLACMPTYTMWLYLVCSTCL